MNTFLVTIRHDLKSLKWMLVLWVGIWAANYWIQLKFLSVEIGVFSLSPAVLSFAINITSLSILGRLAFNHPTADMATAWRTRPMTGWQVAVAKFLFGGVFLVLLPSLFSLFISSNGFQWPVVEMLIMLAELFGVHAVTLGVLLFVASLCRNGSEFVLALLSALWVLWMLSAALYHTEPWRLFDYSPTVSKMLGTVILGLTVIMTIRQYHQPRRLQHASILGLMLLCIIAFVHFRGDDSRGLARIHDEDALLEIKSLTFDEHHNHFLTVMEIDNLNQDHAWQLTDAIAPPDYGDSKRHRSSHGKTLFNRSVVNHQLGLDGFEWVGNGPQNFSGTFTLKSLIASDDEEVTGASLPSNQALKVRLERLQLNTLGSLPLMEGAEISNSNLRVKLEDRTFDSGQLGIKISVAIRHSPHPNSRIAKGGGPRFVFVNRAGGRASLVQHVDSSRFRNSTAGFKGQYAIPLPSICSYPSYETEWELLIADVLPDGYLLLSAESAHTNEP